MGDLQTKRLTGPGSVIEMQLNLENVCFIRRGFSKFKKLFSNSAPPSKSHKQSPRPTFNQAVYLPISQLHFAINLKIHTSPKIQVQKSYLSFNVFIQLSSTSTSEVYSSVLFLFFNLSTTIYWPDLKSR